MKQAAKVWVSYGVRVTVAVTQVYGRQPLDPMWPRSTLCDTICEGAWGSEAHISSCLGCHSYTLFCFVLLKTKFHIVQADLKLAMY